MRPAEEIKKLVKNAKVQTSPSASEKIFKNLANELKATKTHPPAQRMPGIRRILMNRYVQLAAAGIVIAAVLTAATMLAGPQQKQKPIAQENRNYETDDATTLQPQLVANAARQQKLTEELAQVEAMFTAKDIAGLISLLQTGEYETKVAAANYLAQIGDLSAAQALAKLSAQFPDIQPNPFAEAILKIAERLSAQAPPAEAAQAPEPQAKETAVADTNAIYFAGTVTDTNNIPIENVTVTSEMISSFGQMIEEATTITDKDGRFKIGLLRPLAANQNLNARYLTFEHPEHAIEWYHPSSQGEVKDIVVALEAPTLVAGIVKDSKGNPLEGARVQAIVRRQGGKPQIMLFELNGQAAYTDADGWFVFAGIPVGSELKLFADHKTKGSCGADVDDNSSSADAGDQNVEIVLQPGGYIRGQFLLDGKPYEKAGIAIIAKSEKGIAFSSMTQTDDKGTFETGGVVADTYTIVCIYEEFINSDVVCKPVEGVVVSDDGSAADVKMLVTRGIEIEVRVVDQDRGKPVKGAGVWVTLPDGETPAISGYVKSDENGTVTLRLNPGQYQLATRSWADGQSRQVTQDILVDAGKTRQSFELAITQRDDIYGWLVDSNYNPVQGRIILGSGDKFSNSDPDGAFSLPQPYWLPGDTLSGYAFDRTGALGKVFFWQPTDEPNSLEIILEPLATVIGRLIDKDGRPISDIKPVLDKVYPRGLSGAIGRDIVRTSIDKEGNFRFGEVPVGVPMRVFVTKPGHQGRTEPFELQPGQTLNVGEVVLKPLRGFEEPVEWTGVLKGRVVSESNEPMSGARVYVSVGLDSFTDTTDRKGKFTLKGLPKGKRVQGNVQKDFGGYKYTRIDTVVDGNELELKMYPLAWHLLGKEAPGLFVDKWLNCYPLTLEELRGKVVLIETGAYMPYYERYLPQIQELLRKYGDKGLVVITVHQDIEVGREYDSITEEDLRAYIAKHNITHPFALDGGLEMVRDLNPPILIGNGAMYSLYNSRLCLIDKKGIVRIGPTEQNLEEWIKKLLAE